MVSKQTNKGGYMLTHGQIMEKLGRILALQEVMIHMQDEVNALNIYLNKEGAFTVIVHSASGISCIYFAGGMGMIIEKEKGINY